MKKIVSLLLAALLALSLFACAAKPGGESTPADTGTSPSQDAPPAQSSEPPAESSPSQTPEPSDSAPADDLAYILDKGKLVIGITEYAPMNYYDETGKLVGFDTEFAKALCEYYAIEPEFKIIDWSTKEIELKAMNIDCIWNGLTVTEERRENMAFTNSYLRNEQVVVVRASDAEKYVDLNSLKDAIIVAEDESAGATAVISDLPDSAFTPVVSQAIALLEVKSGTADAAVIDYTMARSMTGEGTDYSDLVIVSGIKMTPEEYAIGLRPGSTAVGVFNEAIYDLTATGKLKEFAEKYGVSDLLIVG